MSIIRSVNYTEPVIGADAATQIAFSLGDHVVNGVRKACIIASTSLAPGVAIDVEDAFQNALNGKKHDGYYGHAVTRLSAKEAAAQTVLSVESETGFAAGDPVAIFNVIGDTPEYHLVASFASGTITLDGSGLAGAMYEGAWLVNLADCLVTEARGYNYQQGMIAALSAPDSITDLDIEDGSGDTVNATFTIPSQDKAAYIDIYARATPFTRIDPSWIPDVEDATASNANVTSFGGGADCVPDGAGAVLAASGTYYFAAVVKTGSGRSGNNISGISNVVSFTLDA